MKKCEAFSIGLEYRLLEDGNSYEVTGIGTCADTSIIIPSFYNEKPVISIGIEAFSFCENVTSIKIGDNIVSINDLAFANCKKLLNIKISDSVIYMGAFIIMGCDSLKDIKIPYNVKEISCWTFVGCYSLENIEVDKSNRNYDSREDCNAIIETETNTLLKGCKYSFIPDSIEHIGFLAFEYCNTIESIIIPDDVIIIDREAFANCNKLREITIGNNLTLIKEDAFKNCNELSLVYYKGTRQQWKNIIIEYGNENLTNAIIICNYKIE